MTDPTSNTDLLWDIVRLDWKIHGDARLNDEGIAMISADRGDLTIAVIGTNTRHTIQCLRARVLELSKEKKDTP
jgi:hypothetical protein